MRTIIPATQHYWQELSTTARTLFVLTFIIFCLVMLLLVMNKFESDESRRYYRDKIDRICANEPRLCK